jgi:hypothetical protein
MEDYAVEDFYKRTEAKDSRALPSMAGGGFQ